MKNTIIILGIFTLISCGKTGTQKSYYDDGKLESVEHFIADKLNGTCLYYYEDGTIQAEVICDEGNLIKYTEYHLDGSLKNEFYTNPHNEDCLIYKSYYENGYLSEEIYFGCGSGSNKRKGTIYRYYNYKYDYDSYQLEEIVDFTFEFSPSLMREFRPWDASYNFSIKILERSNSRVFYEMYNLKPELFTKDGKIIDQKNIDDLIIKEFHEKPWPYHSVPGNLSYYYESGKISQEKNYEEGRLIDDTEYYENGQIDSKYTSEDGIYISYYEENGEKKETGFYSNWDNKWRHGEWRSYDINSNLVSVKTYVNGRLNSNIVGVEY